MKLVYIVRIVFEDQNVVGLISPHLKIDFIDKYTELVSKVSSTGATSIKKVDVKHLQMIIEEYISWIQSNNYILRLPNNLQIEHLNVGEQWITIELDYPIKVRQFEYYASFTAPTIYLLNFVLGEFNNILAARIHKISYTTLILPIFLNLVMGSIFYAYSGASSSLATKGRELDDWWYNSKASPDEITDIQLEKKHPFWSTWNLSKTILCTIVLSNVIFMTITYWQISMSLREQLRESDIDDPIITPELVEVVAALNSIISFIYFEMLYTNIALKSTSTLQVFFDTSFTLCKKWINRATIKSYSEVLITDENTESEVDDIDTSTSNIIATSFNIIRPSREKVNEDEEDATVYFIKEIAYNNPLLNIQGFLFETARVGGAKAVQNMINLGEDYEVASTIVEYIEKYGIKHVVKILFICTAKSNVVDLLDKQIVKITEEGLTRKYYETFIGKITEQNFFLYNEKGKNFIQIVADTFDENTLLKMLELGEYQDIAEQIVNEAEIQDINKVVYNLLGEKPLLIRATSNLENIISQEEINQLKLIPNGIFNGWSNKAYHKVVDYIDKLAKSLDDMLNMGKSGNQVAITIALLEEWLGFAASGQRFVGGMPPYYDPNNDDDWSNGDGGSYGYGGTNSSVDNTNGFTGLIFSIYNGTDYNITDHQI